MTLSKLADMTRPLSSGEEERRGAAFYAQESEERSFPTTLMKFNVQESKFPSSTQASGWLLHPCLYLRSMSLLPSRGASRWSNKQVLGAVTSDSFERS